MISAVLPILLKNPSYLSLGALVLSVFFAGTMVQGERVRKQEIKDELREIQKLTEQSLTRVEEINTMLNQEDARLVGEIGEAYEVLAVLNEKERLQRVALEASARRKRRLANQRRQQRQNVNRSAGFIIDNE